MLRLRTFGGCYLERDGSRLDGVSAQRKGLGLLALLAVAGDAGLSRDSAAAHLWPESDETRASASLKQLVHSLRQQLGSPDVILGPAMLRLNPALITSDVREFRDAVARDEMETVAALHAGPFLDGFLLRDADTFERWAASTRASCLAAHAEALETLAEHALARGDSRGAVEWWRRRQAADPLSGRAAAGLMRALDAAGDRAGALRHAAVHDRLLQQELGPSASDPVVAALAAELSAARAHAPAPTPPTPPAPPATPGPPTPPTSSSHAAPTMRASRDRQGSIARILPALFMVASLVVVAVVLRRDAVEPDRGTNESSAVSDASRAGTLPSVAVLPFANTSGDEADEPFADGLTDELIGALGQVAGLEVAPRTSAFALKGKGLDLRTVADTLGVASVLEGSVRRAGERLRITVGLVDAGENRVIWSETYDRELRDVFAVQQEIASAVVRALRVTLAPATVVAAPPATEDLVAYDLYLRGQFFRYQLTGATLQRAVGFFERAIERDSGYAQAYAGLADAHALLVLFGDRPPREGFRRAREAALTALRLDSTLAQAHASLGHIETAHDWNWESAGIRLARAMALDPASTTIRLWRGLWLYDQRRFQEAIPLLERSLASDPLSTAVRLTLGRIHVSLGQPERAIAYLQGTLELNPRMPLAHQQLGHAFLQRGMKDEALDEFRLAAAISGARDSAQLAYGYAVTGRRTDAERIVTALVESSSRRYVSPFDLAVAYVGLGDTDAAFRLLERAFGEHAAGMDTIAITPALAPLYRDPRWARLLRRMGLQP